MEDTKKTKAQLIAELEELRKRESGSRRIKPIESNIQNNPELLDLFFKHTLDCVVLLDKDFNFIRVNEAYAKVCQREVSEFPGHNHFEFYPSDAQAIFEDVVKTKKPFEIHARPFEFPDHPELSVTYWDWTLVPYLDDKEDVCLLVFTLKDVTKQVNAENELKKHQNHLEGLVQKRTAELQREIIKRQLVVDSLRESQKRFQALIESTNDFVWEIDTNGVYTYCSLQNYELWGYKPEDMIGRTPFDLMIPEDREHAIKMFRTISEPPSSFKGMETSSYDKAGRIVVVETSGVPFFDIDGRLCGYRGISRDITERKKAEEALLESEEKHRTLFETMVQGVVYQDYEGKIESANLAAERILGLTLDQMQGRTSLDPRWKSIHEDGSDFPGETHPAMVALKTGKEVIDVIMGVYHPQEKKHRWININAIPQFKSGGKKPFQVYTTFEDITERKKDEETLLLNSEMIKNMTEGIYLVGIDDVIIKYANPKFEKMFGYEAGEMIGKHASIVNAPTDKDPLERASEIMKVIRETGEWHGEVNNIKKDGTPFWCYANVSVFEHPVRGNVLMAVHTDITENKKSQQIIENNQFYLKKAQEIGKIGHFSFDPVTNSVEGSTELFRIFDVDQDQPLFKAFSDNVHPEGGHLIFPYIGRAVKEGIPYDVEHRVRHRNGTILHVHAKGEIIITSEGQRMVGTIQDITERKRVEDELRESERRLKEAQRLGRIGYWEYDLNTQQIKWSDMVFTLYERDPKLGQPTEEEEAAYYSPEDAKMLHNFFERSVNTGEPWEVDVSVKLPGERLMNCISIGVSIKDIQGQVFKIYGTIQDITEHKQLEEERAKASKLESIGILAGGIAHDFNNILAVILGNTSLAKIRLANKVEAEELLTEVEEASVRATKLTQQLLTFAKGGAPIKETTELTVLISETARFSLRGSNVQHRTSFNPELWIANIDKGQISQVIGNLVINAQQAMPEGGTINIKADNLTITPKDKLPLKEGNYIKISLEDKGHGISAEQLTKIFDPYFTTKQMGSGLGLATVYSIIHRHDGHITVESELGAGTTFHIYLPATAEQVEKKEAVKEESTVITGKILVMDDEEMLRNFVSKALKSFGNDVDEASNGAEAIEKYKKAMKSGKPFDVVIMDLTIPGGMGGQVAIKKLLEIDPDAKAVVSSGYANDPVISNFEAYGFKGFIPKPYKFDELKKVLNEVMSGK